MFDSTSNQNAISSRLLVKSTCIFFSKFPKASIKNHTSNKITAKTSEVGTNKSFEKTTMKQFSHGNIHEQTCLLVGDGELL